MIRINLLPVKQAKKRGAGQQQLILLVIILIILGLVMFSSYKSEQIKITELVEREGKIKTEMDRLEELIGDIENFEKKKLDLKKKLGIIDLLKKGKTGPVRILDELSTIIPKKVWLSDLTEGNRKLKLVGSATENKEIAIFMRNLESSRFFSNVNLLSIEQTKDVTLPIPVMKFTITCDYSVPQS